MTQEPSAGLFEAAADAEATAEAIAAAAPVVAERSDAAVVQSLDTSLREPVFRLLSSLADNKYVLGRRYAEWCTGAPALESAVAAAAMAQDELGHARSFYPLLRGFEQAQQSMEDKGWQQRPTSAMACLDRHFSSWADYVAANLLVDSALSTLLAAAVDAGYEPLRQRARKIGQEEAAHWVHATGWLCRLAAQPDLLPALTSVWDDAFTWFGQPDDPTLAPLVAAGLLARDPDALRAALLARLEPVLRSADLLDKLQQRDLPWHRWNPQTRRLG